MNYVGVDIHKKYSVLCALDESGRKLREGRVESNGASGFAQFFASLDGPSQAVVEACWNWGLIHDELEELDRVEEPRNAVRSSHLTWIGQRQISCSTH
jgi:hypothetical protein